MRISFLKAKERNGKMKYQRMIYMVSMALAVIIAAPFVSSDDTNITEVFAAASCSLDHISSASDSYSKSEEAEQLEELPCRPFTDEECVQRYGDVTVFNNDHQRCVWGLPAGVTASEVQLISNSIVDEDRCAFVRSLNEMLLAWLTETELITMPLADAGLTGIPVRCGGIDLRAWTAYHAVYINSSSVSERVSDLPFTDEGIRSEQPVQPTPVWARITLIFLSFLGAACVVEAAVIIRRSFLKRKTELSQADASGDSAAALEEKVHSTVASIASSFRKRAPDASPRALSRFSSPLSVSEGTQRPGFRLDVSVEPRASLSGSFSILESP
ncbi:hypothetical protein TcCL_NonESM04232 [Trypanosoma cruzi]|uniref:Transmembrane protein n=2 Tax=Trypanosoma cruzi TaxID=5693 RepID=Q4DXM1_TRYCC|nr:hypothetical protein, conserved [Trypanosoma cruzi]EAN97247.1 hypothetical protein, conserved [Trypanosoma cruzi]RNC46005.1 hypothetical protein TcCL_NonESM04232 [Trypanosoma cruzi]|eukprot:XP_819098.1 hypothetical protein [Trypanosoma cruzi strain CL Brener]